MKNAKLERNVIRTTAYLAIQHNGGPALIVAVSSDITDGCAFAWELGSRRVSNFESDDDPRNESRTFIYSTDVDKYRVVLIAHNQRDAATMEDRMREAIKENQEVTHA